MNSGTQRCVWCHESDHLPPLAFPFSYIFRVAGTFPDDSQGSFLLIPVNPCQSMALTDITAGLCPYHIPDKIREPVDDRLHATDEL